ncbi:hypothetical protein BKA56DRAFT_652611 [Ilyonectria sp. MPI-CAGE-AT-0026]|nr:hypothetical protein BKA56DRAFT_652611 [Ilyonectria sp. MPI-CAGE-AT-0026]
MVPWLFVDRIHAQEIDYLPGWVSMRGFGKEDSRPDLTLECTINATAQCILASVRQLPCVAASAELTDALSNATHQLVTGVCDAPIKLFALSRVKPRNRTEIGLAPGVLHNSGRSAKKLRIFRSYYIHVDLVQCGCADNYMESIISPITDAADHDPLGSGFVA